MQNNHPGNIDREILEELFAIYGGPEIKDRFEELGSGLGFHGKYFAPEDPGDLNEFAAAGITKAEDVRDRFLNHFYFGTESDDIRVAYAYYQKANPYGDRVKAFLGSDSGHWDVPDITAVTANAYSFVERGIFSEDDLRHFLSTYPLELYTSLNRDFFKGTAIEKDAEAYLASVGR